MAEEIKSTDFGAKVIQASFQTPVVADFWAAWCNPCRALTPILKKLETNYQGKFKLATIDTEENPEITEQYNITGIPNVLFFYQGKIKDQFTGLLPEEYVRQFLDKNIPHPALKEIRDLLDQKKWKEAGEKLINENIKSQEANAALWEIFRNLILGENDEKDIKDLKKYIDQMIPLDPALSEVKTSFSNYFQQALAGHPVNFAALLKPGETKTLLDQILNDIVSTKDKEREVHKTRLFCCFHLMGNSPLVMEYRKKLSRALF